MKHPMPMDLLCVNNIFITRFSKFISQETCFFCLSMFWQVQRCKVSMRGSGVVQGEGKYVG